MFCFTMFSTVPFFHTKKPKSLKDYDVNICLYVFLCILSNLNNIVWYLLLLILYNKLCKFTLIYCKYVLYILQFYIFFSRYFLQKKVFFKSWYLQYYNPFCTIIYIIYNQHIYTYFIIYFNLWKINKRKIKLYDCI